jgi:hypothetical protein
MQLSYWVGHRCGPQMRGHWPFRRYPQLLDRGERVFRRHGAKGLVVARFVGAVRPFVPAIAGMLGMPLRRYVPVSLFAAVMWGGRLPRPGWVFGKSYDPVAAGRRPSSRWSLPACCSRSPWSLGGRVVHVALVRGTRRSPARTRVALDARASPPRPLCRGAHRSQPARNPPRSSSSRPRCW